mgnify:CR=1 FL=1
MRILDEETDCYKLYSDGYLECFGVLTLPCNRAVKIDLPKEYSDNNYSVVVESQQVFTVTKYRSFSTISVNQNYKDSFIIGQLNNLDRPLEITWRTFGYCKI